jgi:uncharacterized membrane protein YjjP (DUF1212 family)
MDLPNEFFTVNSFATLAGATAIVWVSTSVIKFLLDGKIQVKWIAFVLSELVSFLGAFYLTAPPEKISLVVRALIALINGFLIFATALGLNAITTKPDGEAVPGKKKPYWARW